MSRKDDINSAGDHAWLRLRDGTFRDSDIVLLEHELLESNYLRTHPGASYREAHAVANARFDWQRLIEEGN